MSRIKLKLNVDSGLLEKARQAEIALDAAFEAGLKLALSQADQSPPLNPADGERRSSGAACSDKI
jgi:post-segregation antitoxin (ccd killing protein)